MSIIDATPYYGRRKRFFQQRLFIGGAVAGLLLGIVLTTIGLAVLGPHDSIPQNAKNSHAGNMTISMDNPLLSAGMRLALKREQNKLPFPISDASAQTVKGDHIDLIVDVPTPVGITAQARFGLSPTINNKGQIDFKVVSVNLGGIEVGFAVSGIVEDALNQQFADFGQGQLVQGLDYQLIGVSTTDSALVVTARLTSTS
jgi:hypothetical protein